MLHKRRFPSAYVLATLTFVPAILNGCSCDDEEPPTPEKPRIAAFSATPAMVAPNGKTTIAWRVENATEISVVATPGGILVDKVATLEGSKESGEITANTSFTLTARGEGGEATRTITVTVNEVGMVMIDSFEATPATIAPGDSATLAYEVTNATRVRIDEVNGANLLDTTTMFMGTVTVMPTMTTSYVITADGNGGPVTLTRTVEVENTPVIVSFEANPQMIELGDMTTISWNVTDAATIVIRDSGGTEVFNGTDATGMRTVSPTANETYTLTAMSAQGQSVTGMVMVTVNRAARIISFTANPAAVDFGDSSELRWEVIRATSVEIQVGGVTATTSTDLTGAFTVTATRTTDYTLIARNVDGDSTAMVTLTVNPTLARITRFEASPNPALIGTSSELSWTTIGALNIRVTDDEGTVVYDGTDAIGNVSVPVATASVTYTLTAGNPFGDNTTTLVLRGQNIPEIQRFVVTPLTFSGANTTVTVDWDASDALGTTLQVNGTLIPNFPGTAAGIFSFTASSSVDLLLTATNDVGMDTASGRVTQLAVGIENGNTATTAQPLAGDGGGVAGTIGAANDVDYYSVVVPANGNIWAQTSDGQGACALNTVLTLYGTDGTTVLGSDNDDGAGNCSEIDPVRDAFAANLAAGTYYIAVRGNAAADLGSYALLVRVEGPRCANRIRERGAGEQCDDGNTVATDGCDATCQIEPVGTVMGPGASQLFTSTIEVLGRELWFRVDMQAEGYIRVETFIPAVGRCDGAGGAESTDLLAELYSSTFAVLGTDDNDGIGSCTLFDPAFDPWTRVQAGTYWVRVIEDGDNARVGTFLTDIRTLGVGCGNNIIEAGETCDDGNANSGDGCSNVCVFEGGQEAEPNGTFGTATPIVGNSADIAGSITPVADVDFYAVTVPQGYHLHAWITVNSQDNCPADSAILTGRLQLLGTNGTTVLATNTTDGPAANCGRIWPYTDVDSRNMAAGTYYIRVNESGDNATIPLYFLHVRLLAPGCGNEILEGTEQCEDDNIANGDGCSATCTAEPLATVNLPSAGTTTVAGMIDPAYDRDFVRLNVTAPVYLRAETFEPNAASGACANADTVLRLLDDDALTVIGSDDQDGVGSCSLINPLTDTFARLSTGTYYLQVEEFGQNRTIFAYELTVESRPVDVCGNQVTERPVGEQCDDGNTLSSDGCSATCQIEPDGVVAGPPGSMVFSGGITPVGDTDIYRLDLTAPSIIYAETYIPTVGQCTGGDTLIRLFNLAGTQIASNDDINGAANRCSRIDGRTTAAARVAAGTYFLTIEDFANNDEIASYQIDIRVQQQNICGNGLVESTNQEICDDGNTAAGDGCSATCTPEPVGTLVGPGVQTFTNDINPATQVDYYQVDLAAPSVLHVETGAPAMGACATADTVVRIYDNTGVELVSDDQDGINSCSLIDPSVDTGARVPAGTYYVAVHSFNFATTIAPYQVRIDARLQNTCGNRVREGAEACDDGNTANGDGCSSICALEGVFVPEVEANNTPATATPLGVLVPGSTDISAAITPVGDNDFFTFTLGAAGSVLIRTYGTVGNITASCPGDTIMWLYSGPPTNLTTTSPTTEPTIVQYDDDDGFGACSIIGGTDTNPVRVNLGAGTYYIQVRRFANSAVIAQYYVNVNVQ